MSLSDPLLKSLKYLVQEFHSMEEAVTDISPYLEQMFTTLEHCFIKGLKPGPWDVTRNKHTARGNKFWAILNSFETNGPTPYAVTSAIQAALKDKRVKTPYGRLRYLIRYCLVHKSLHVLVEFLMGRREDLKQWYYEDQNSGKQAMKIMAEFGGGSSIITHEELSEQLRSLLLTCSTSLSFNLNLNATYFLDESWETPTTVTIEFVPSTELGIELVYINGYAIITRLKPRSLASEALSLGVGDLLAEMNGKILFPARVNGENDAITVWRTCKAKSFPCKLTVVKPKSSGTGGIYPPLKDVLREYHSWMAHYYRKRQKKLDKETSEKEIEEHKLFHPSRTDEQTPVLDPYAAEEGVGGKFALQYVGEVCTGEEGGVNQIERVIRQGLQKCNERTTFNVQMTVTQIAVVTELLNKRKCQPLFNHKYADISSCGKLITDEELFCYIAGDTYCTISKQFKGYVFRARSLTQARAILNAINQGFKRTTWFM